jgi:hypothetical protein
MKLSDFESAHKHKQSLWEDGYHCGFHRAWWLGYALGILMGGFTTMMIVWLS